MSTHTDGVPPSVRSGPSVRAAPPEPHHGTGGESPSGAAAIPPRPRRSDATRADPDAPPSDEDGDGSPGRGEAEPSRRAAADPASAESGPSWVQQEIARRIAEKQGVTDTGRHARPDLAPGATATPQAGEAEDDDQGPRAVPGRARSFRERSDRMPDPYSPEGLREPGTSGGWPPAGDGTGPEPPFRLAGPASRSAAQAPGDEQDTAVPGANGTKPWPPADGAAGLPRRVPGAGWTLDRATLLGGAGASETDTDTETRPVPSMWAPTGRRPTPEPTVTAPADVADYDDEDDDEDPRGPAVERTEVIWRAPGLDDEPEPVTGAAGTTGPAVAAPPDGTPSQQPYTGARPRRFAGAPTDPDPVEPAAEEAVVADGPEGRRVRIVLSERRTTTHSVRPVVDVQDPGSVGTTLRNGLLNNQLGLALRIFGVALLGLGLPPALFAAFPSIGEVSVIGLRVPWLLLGFLVYPFLLGLGWWYVRSAERVEQDFAEGVQDR